MWSGRSSGVAWGGEGTSEGTAGAVAVCLEAAWNSSGRSTAIRYRAMGVERA